MPEKWQKWMPLDIDKFRSSPAVQAMHPAARSGYLYLLMSAWQTDDCTLANDPLGLAEQSGLGDEFWNMYGARILRKFDVLDNGRLRNIPEYKEWIEAKRIFESRKEAAKKTNDLRSPNAHRTPTASVTERSPLRSAHTVTETGTLTEKQKPARKDALERIYQVYPKRVGKDAALKAIDRALKRSALSVEAMTAKVEAYAKKRHGEDAQYTPNPATWFNQGRYDDEEMPLLPMPPPEKSTYELSIEKQFEERRKARNGGLQ